MNFYCVDCNHLVAVKKEESKEEVKYICPLCGRLIATQLLIKEVMPDDKNN